MVRINTAMTNSTSSNVEIGIGYKRNLNDTVAFNRGH